MYVLKISSPYSKQKGHFYYSMSTVKSFFLCKLPCPDSFPSKNLFFIIFQIATESYITVESDWNFQHRHTFWPGIWIWNPFFYKYQRKYLASDFAINSGKVYYILWSLSENIETTAKIGVVPVVTSNVKLFLMTTSWGWRIFHYVIIKM